MRGLLSLVRRASAFTYRVLIVLLLALVYAAVLPWFALFRRLVQPPTGWRERNDADLTSLPRLRQPF